MRALPLIALLLLASTPAWAQARRVVLVCPVTGYDGLDPKLLARANGWLNDAVLARRVGRVDSATRDAELKDLGLTGCPLETEALRSLGQTLRASHVLLIRISYPTIVGGLLLPLDSADAAPIRKAFPPQPTDSGRLDQVIRERISTFVDSVLPEGEELIAPLTPQKPPEDNPVVSVAPPPVKPVEKPVSRPRLTTGATIAFDTGGVALASGAATWWLASQRDGEFDAYVDQHRPLTPPDEPRLAELQQQGAQLRTASAVLAAVAGAAAVTGLVLVFTAPPEPQVQLSATPAGVMLSGRF